jgi:hypothetical protein
MMRSATTTLRRSVPMAATACIHDGAPAIRVRQFGGVGVEGVGPVEDGPGGGAACGVPAGGSGVALGGGGGGVSEVTGEAPKTEVGWGHDTDSVKAESRSVTHR